MAEALGELRRFNYERIYLRPASVEQGEAVVKLLRTLVEAYGADPSLLPVERGASELTPQSTEALRAAVTYVGGMTDRFACTQAVQLLGYDPSALPRGIDLLT
jgi:dGTPase